MQAPFQSAVQPRWEGEGTEPVSHLPDGRLTHSSLKIHAALFCLTSNMPGLKLTAHWCHLIMLSPLSLFPNEELGWDAGEHLTSSAHLAVRQFTQLKKFQDLKDWRLDSRYKKKEPLVICSFVLILETLLISELLLHCCIRYEKGMCMWHSIWIRGSCRYTQDALWSDAIQSPRQAAMLCWKTLAFYLEKDLQKAADGHFLGGERSTRSLGGSIVSEDSGGTAEKCKKGAANLQ